MTLPSISPGNKSKRRVLIVGLGDLGSRLSQVIAERGLAGELKIASRSETAQQWAQMLAMGTDCCVSAEKLDGLDSAGTKRVLTDFEPDLIIQCAALLSPWALLETNAPPALEIVKAGFAMQASAQLPVILNLMRVRADLGLSCPVINCSFPDLINVILYHQGLAPTAGVGNVAMIARYLEVALRDRNRGRLRVIAHHAHVTPILTGRGVGPSLPLPIVEENGEILGEKELRSGPSLALGREFNYLTASTTIALIAALLDEKASVLIHAPGVLGLPGGYPISLRAKQIDLDLPPQISRDQAIAFNSLCARADGIERIDPDGTLVYTDDAKRASKPFCEELTRPLPPSEVLSRWEVLKSFYKECQDRRAKK